MQDTRILRGAPNRAFPAEVLKKYIEHLGSEIVSVTKGETTLTQCIIKNWREQDGVYEIVFSERALIYLKSMSDPRMDMVDSLFAAIGDDPAVPKQSQGWFANVRSPIGQLSTPMAFIWFACTIAGPLLTYVDNPSIAQLGKGLIMMSLGYLLFGLGLQRKSPKSPVKSGPNKYTSRTSTINNR
jgi:hypothetical protein